MAFWPVWALLMATSIAGGGAVLFSLPPAGSRCVSEEIQTNAVVLGSYAVVHEDGERNSTATVSVKVASPYGNILHQQKNATEGEFGFTASEAGSYLACFWPDGVHGGPGASISLNWKTGVAAKDWDAVAKKEKIEGVEIELRKLEEVVEAIHEDMLYLKDREAEMMIVSERTNVRVALFSIFSFGVCIIVSVLQVWYLKGFFLKKKLI